MSIAPDSQFINLDHFANRPTWVAWRNTTITNPKTGKVTIKKIPYTNHQPTPENKRTYIPAQADDPSTWMNFNDAFALQERIVNGQGGGVGIMLGIPIEHGLAPDEQLGGVDLDTCRDKDGVLTPWASEIMARYQSYTEVSPSKTGVKVLFRYRLRDLKRLQENWRGIKTGMKVATQTGTAHPPAIELYLDGRYFAVTCEADGYPQAIRLVDYDDLEWLIQAMGRFDSGSTSPQGPVEPLARQAPQPNTDTDQPRVHRDQSRSGAAFGRVCHWLREGYIASYEQMVAKLLRDQQTADWAQDYQDEPDHRQFTRLWERANDELKDNETRRPLMPDKPTENAVGIIKTATGQVEGVAVRVHHKPSHTLRELDYMPVEITESYMTGVITTNPETGKPEQGFIAVYRLERPAVVDDWRVNVIRDALRILTGATTHDWPVQITGDLVSSGPPVDLFDKKVQDRLATTFRPKEEVEPVDPAIAARGIVNIRWEVFDLDLPPIEKLLYIALIGRCGRQTKCLVSHDRLVTDTSSSPKSVERALYGDKRSQTGSPGLVGRGLVVVEPHKHKNMNLFVLPKLVPIDLAKSKEFWKQKRAKQ